MKNSLLVLLILSSITALGQTNQYQNVLNYYNSEKNFNGVALVATNGKIDFINGVGIANCNTPLN